MKEAPSENGRRHTLTFVVFFDHSERFYFARELKASCFSAEMHGVVATSMAKCLLKGLSCSLIGSPPRDESVQVTREAL